MKIIHYNLLFVILILMSCSEVIEVDGNIEDFKVSTDSLTFKVGDVVNFNLEGNPGVISFYSGEIGHNYTYREGRVVETEAAKTMSFKSSVQDGTQPDQLSVKISTDFNGNVLDFANVTAANWTDITDRFILGTNSTFVASGAADISDLAVEGKPVYIAFRYLTKPQGVNGTAQKWMIRNFSLTTESEIGTLTLADSKTAWFSIVDQIPDSIPSKSTVSSTTITFQGNSFTGDDDPSSEDWAISSAIHVGNIDLGPDRPVAVKGYSDVKQESYSYVYTEPGVYDVCFVALNTNIDQTLEVVRQIKITITE